MKKSIAIDMDGVIADTETHLLNWYERDYGVRISLDEIQGLDEKEIFPDKTQSRKYVLTPGFFRTLPLMNGAVEAVKTLMESYEVYIVSAAMEFPLSLAEKLEWLNEHFPFIDWRHIIFCGDKSIINTDYMIDDHIKNLDYFKGTTIMFHAFHNVNYDHHQRVNNWDEVLELLEK
ncbi:5'(3')-deoxyribonucleotidase [Mucilaginibacter sp. BJC16-A38]|uniref:5' nucleotidase, NT5C type n=1 Tax=Mucilaginibacter phenanthrenivorans TaxID=1234842 RepID=UPI00215827E4|nr:5'(3')-deoxyribonucleotidase [Mucilaginibacter phenanthrenivorans]MCR8558385.1 5'(3')-deoxyribonucleotidase [Mucilaginibacter phenanthrenivorans]